MPARTTLGFLAGTLAAMLLATGMTFLVRHEQARAAIGGSFAMVDMTGQPVTDADLLGRPSALVFGFTQCPDTCPTTLTTLTQVMKTMGAEADRLNVVFVTVDPGRDTPEVLREYLSSFDPRIRGFYRNFVAIVQGRADMTACEPAVVASTPRRSLAGGPSGWWMPPTRPRLRSTGRDNDFRRAGDRRARQGAEDDAVPSLEQSGSAAARSHGRRSRPVHPGTGHRQPRRRPACPGELWARFPGHRRGCDSILMLQAADEAQRAAYWHRRYDTLRPLFERAVERGEVPADTPWQAYIDAVIGTAYFQRTLKGESASLETQLFLIGRLCAAGRPA